MWLSAARRDPFAALFVEVLVYEITASTLFGFGNPVALVEWLCLAAATGRLTAPDTQRHECPDCRSPRRCCHGVGEQIRT